MNSTMTRPVMPAPSYQDVAGLLAAETRSRAAQIDSMMSDPVSARVDRSLFKRVQNFLRKACRRNVNAAVTKPKGDAS